MRRPGQVRAPALARFGDGQIRRTDPGSEEVFRPRGKSCLAFTCAGAGTGTPGHRATGDRRHHGAVAGDDYVLPVHVPRQHAQNAPAHLRERLPPAGLPPAAQSAVKAHAWENRSAETLASEGETCHNVWVGRSPGGVNYRVFTWWQWLLIVLAALALGYAILWQTPWFKVRKYALDLKRLYDKHKLQEKAQQAQALGQNPNMNPVLLRKPLREIISTYEALIADMNKLKVPPRAKTLHELSLAAAKDSLAMYQMAAVGGFRQKAIMEKMKRVQRLQEQIQAETEKLYGKPKEPKKKK